jgi:hypothetical protein
MDFYQSWTSINADHQVRELPGSVLNRDEAAAPVAVFRDEPA